MGVFCCPGCWHSLSLDSLAAFDLLVPWSSEERFCDHMVRVKSDLAGTSSWDDHPLIAAALKASAWFTRLLGVSTHNDSDKPDGVGDGLQKSSE